MISSDACVPECNYSKTNKNETKTNELNNPFKWVKQNYRNNMKLGSTQMLAKQQTSTHGGSPIAWIQRFDWLRQVRLPRQKSARIFICINLVFNMMWIRLAFILFCFWFWNLNFEKYLYWFNQLSNQILIASRNMEKRFVNSEFRLFERQSELGIDAWSIHCLHKTPCCPKFL